jgi:hypothetical protein
VPEFPTSPDHVIDPRWNSYLRPRQSTRPAQHAHAMPADELDRQLRAIVGRWEAGDEGPHETLEALRELAERAL